MLYEEIKDLIPAVYFGGEEVPPYLHIEMNSSSPVENLVSAIRAIGTGGNSSGYIDDEGIHFHLPDNEIIRVDLSKYFIFLSQPSAHDGQFPSAWQIFAFLQAPATRALFIGMAEATLIEKTAHTLRLCDTLDRIWADDRFNEFRMRMVESEETRGKGLAHLLKSYEDKFIGSSTEMWEFWETFGRLLMENSLGLMVSNIEL